jgi:hypothetical protein
MLEPPPHAVINAATANPIAKVSNPAWVAAISTVLVWAAKTYWHTEIPSDVAIAGVGMLCFIVAYLTPIRRRDLK